MNQKASPLSGFNVQIAVLIHKSIENVDRAGNTIDVFAFAGGEIAPRLPCPS